MKEQDYDKLFELLVKKFNLHKNQSTTDTFIKKGEITALSKISKLLENIIIGKYLEKQRNLKSYKDDNTSMKKFNLNSFGSKNSPEVLSVLSVVKSNISKEKSALHNAQALEKLFSILDNNLEDSLRELDMFSLIENNKSNVSKDVELRMKQGKCALKRPGRVKFPCDEPLVPGEKYCKEHLKQFNPERYYDLFDSKDED